ncbi:MAG TPA: hypothetical protein VJ962_10010 [Clostridia bacterium]|nr:hypothetical protein [Clostridia bacterium]
MKKIILLLISLVIIIAIFSIKKEPYDHYKEKNLVLEAKTNHCFGLVAFIQMIQITKCLMI